MALKDLTQPDNGYKVIPSNLSGLVDSMSEGTQEEQVQDVAEIDPNPAPSEDMPPANFIDPSAEPRGASAAEGRIITMVIDRCAAASLAALAKGETRDYRAKDDEYRDLEKAVAEYMAETNTHTSPLTQLIMALVAIYLIKLPDALKERKKVIDQEKKEAKKEAKKQLALVDDVEEATKKEANNGSATGEAVK